MSAQDGGEEISLSIEETNALRAKLGLRPLDLSSKSSSSAPLVDAAAVAAQEREAAAVRERIERARREREAREMAERAARGSLGEQLQAEAGSLSAADWVAATRQAGATRPAAPAAGGKASAGTSGTRAKSATSAGVAAALPEGLKIRGNEADFAAGSEVVLTLRDTGLLDAEGNELAGDEDELVNSDIASRYRSEELAARKRDGKKGIYAAADENEFGAGGVGRLDEFGNPLPGRSGGGGVLAHYDEEGKEGLDRLSTTLVIGAGGKVVDTSGAKGAGGGLSRALADAEALAKGAVKIDASATHVGATAAMAGVSAVRFQSDYVTPAEERARIEEALLAMGYEPAVAAAAAAAQTAPKRQRAVRRHGAEEGEGDDDEESAAASSSSRPASAAGPARPRLGGPSLDDDADEDTSGAGVASTRRLAEQLRREGGGGGGRDRGSRAARREGGAGGGGGVAASDLVADAEARHKSLQAFDRALAAASAKAETVLGGPAAPSTGSTSATVAAAATHPAASGWTAVDGDEVATAALPNLAALRAAVSTASARGRQHHRVYSRLREDDEEEVQAPASSATAGAAAPAPAPAEQQEDDDAELGAVLARARRLAAAKVPAGGNGAVEAGVVDAGAARVAAALKADRGGASSGPLSPPSASGGEGKGGIVFTETTELARLLQAQMVAKQAEAAGAEASVPPPPVVQAAAAALADEEANGAGHKRPRAAAGEEEGAAPAAKRRRFDAAPGAVLGVSSSSSGGAGASRSWKAVMDDEDEEGGEEQRAGDAEGGGLDVSDGGSSGSEDEDDDEEGGGGRSKARLATLGLGAALGMLREVGALGAKGTDRYSGRTKDNRPGHAAPDNDDGGVKLEYRDALGNLLTAKQAYRELSYKFHGRAPSQKTLDKRMRQMVRDRSVASTSATDTALASSMALERLTEAQGAASIVLK